MSSLHHTLASLDASLEDIASFHDQTRATQTARNELAPINKLPNEILALIFLYRRNSCYFISPGRNWRWTRGTLDVCSRWRSIGFSSPYLWNYVVVEEYSQLRPILKLLKRWSTPIDVEYLSWAQNTEETRAEALGALSKFLTRAATIVCRLSLPEVRVLMSKTPRDSFFVSKLWRLDIRVPASVDEVYPLLVPLLKRASNLRFLALADSRGKENTNVEAWQVNSMDLVVNFPTLFPKISSLELTGDYVAGFLASTDSNGFFFPQLRRLEFSHSLIDHVIDLLPRFQKPKGFKTFIIEQPFYRNPADLRGLAEVMTTFFSSSPHPVHFHDLECSVYDIGIEFYLRTSTNDTAGDKAEFLFVLRLLYIPNDSHHVVPAVLDGLNLDLIEKLTLGGQDFPQLTSQSWKFTETLQTLVLRDIETPFLLWASRSSAPNLNTLVIETTERPTDFPMALVMNLLYSSNGGEDAPRPLLVIKGNYPPAFKPSLLFNMGFVDEIEYQNGLDKWEATTEFTDQENSGQEDSYEEDSNEEDSDSGSVG
ncbi:hypothetical protein DL96DRAFT_1558749 [Flagelloscypha sp. PMI_526]|nr:hypothetical protein DL96DRAFT_1558749 [Flagelloscypha sp. PMI_526]